MNLRVFELSVSLPLLAITLIILTLFLYFRIRNAKRKIYIPMIISSYGLIYSILQVYVLSVGYDGIIFILISWLFIFLLIISILYAVFKTFKMKNNWNYKEKANLEYYRLKCGSFISFLIELKCSVSWITKKDQTYFLMKKYVWSFIYIHLKVVTLR